MHPVLLSRRPLSAHTGLGTSTPVGCRPTAGPSPATPLHVLRWQPQAANPGVPSNNLLLLPDSCFGAMLHQECSGRGMLSHYHMAPHCQLTKPSRSAHTCKASLDRPVHHTLAQTTARCAHECCRFTTPAVAMPQHTPARVAQVAAHTTCASKHSCAAAKGGLINPAEHSPA